MGAGYTDTTEPHAWGTSLPSYDASLVGSSIAWPSNCVCSNDNVGPNLMSDTANGFGSFDVYEALVITPVNVAVSNNSSIQSSSPNHGLQVTLSNQDDNIGGGSTRHICGW
jgi:hypothetical protein